jgi:hypothetical protein
LGLAACTRAPLDSSATAPSTPGPLKNGQIGATLYNGALPNGAGVVDLWLPDGSKLSQNAAPTCTFTALTQIGAYRIQFRDQAATQAAYQTVTLSAATPRASVCLQVGGAALQVSPAPYQPGSFSFAAAAFIYTVQVTQAPAALQDYLLDIDPASLPHGWTASFGQTVARGSLSTSLLVNAAEATTITAVALKLRARAGAVELDQLIPLQKAWSLSLSSQENGASVYWDPTKNVYVCTASYSVRVAATGLAAGQSVYLHCVSCPSGMEGPDPDGLLVPANQSVTVNYGGAFASCFPNVVSVCLDAYCGPAQTL